MQALHLRGKTQLNPAWHISSSCSTKGLTPNLYLLAVTDRADSGAPLWGSRSTYSRQWLFKKGDGGTHSHQCAGTEISHPSSQVPLKPCHTPQVWPLDERVHVGRHIGGTWAMAAERQAEICMGVRGCRQAGPTDTPTHHHRQAEMSDCAEQLPVMERPHGGA